jgi:hypothetical protein
MEEGNIEMFFLEVVCTERIYSGLLLLRGRWKKARDVEGDGELKRQEV